MPYKTRNDLPEDVKGALSPVPHAQDIYKEAFNSAVEQYGDESRAHATAWSAVKKKYVKGDDDKWHPKDD